MEVGPSFTSRVVVWVVVVVVVFDLVVIVVVEEGDMGSCSTVSWSSVLLWLINLSSSCKFCVLTGVPFTSRILSPTLKEVSDGVGSTSLTHRLWTDTFSEVGVGDVGYCMVSSTEIENLFWPSGVGGIVTSWTMWGTRDAGELEMMGTRMLW